MPVRPHAVAALLLLCAGVVLATASPAAAEPGFGTASVDVAPPAPGTPVEIRSVDVGTHQDFDRVVFTVSGPTLGYRVGYVPGLVQDGSGATVPVTGAAIVGIVLRTTNWTVHPSPTVDRSPGYAGLVQIRSAGEFEGYATYGIGQASKAGFRVFRLTGPDRIVVDVRHPVVAAGSSPSAAPRSTTEPAAGNGSAAPTPSGELAETGTGTNPVPLAILGGLLALAGIVAITAGVRLTRRPRA